MKDEQKVYIRGVEGRGDEVLKMLEERGGKHLYDGGNQPARIYFIGYDGMVYSAPIESVTGKILMDCYIELHLPEKWKDGDILINKNADYKFCVFDDYLSKTGSGNELFFFHCEVTSHKGESYLVSTNRGRFHDVNDYRLATPQEVEQFYEAIHEHCKDWDAENKRLVYRRWEPKENDSYYYIDNDGDIVPDTWDEFTADDDRYDFGNCFRTEEEARAMAEKVKKLLKGE